MARCYIHKKNGGTRSDTRYPQKPSFKPMNIRTSGQKTTPLQYELPTFYNSLQRIPEPPLDEGSEIIRKGRDYGKMQLKSKRRYWKVSVFERELVVSNRYEKTGPVSISDPDPERDRPPTRTAGDIQRFSQKSRRRLFRLFNRIQVKLIGRPVFITFTARAGLLTDKEFQYAFHHKIKPYLRKLFPGSSAVWRLEPHRSGRPHYHLLFWSRNPDVNIDSEYWKRKIRKRWRAVIGDPSRAAELYACKIKSIGSVQEMFAYLSKYLAKEDDQESGRIRGRRWGTLGDLPCSPITEFFISAHDQKALWQLARAYLLDRGKTRLVDIVDEYGGSGWSVWMQLDEMIPFLRELHVPVAELLVKNYKDPP